MKRSEALHLRKVIEAAMDGDIDDETALGVVALFPEWDSTAVYEKDKRVRYGGILYRCLQAHTAQADWTPVDAASLWARVLIPDEAVVPAWEQPDSTNPYAKGDKVTHNGKTWVSTVNDNIWEPGVYGWEETEA